MIFGKLGILGGLGRSGVGGFTGVIDRLSVAPIFAASTRALTTPIPTVGATIRRVSDSDPYDAGFVGSPPTLDFSGINTHIGGSSGTWPKWWDQSPSANHAAQTTTSSQPAYVDGMGPSFNGSSQYMSIPHAENQLLTSGYTFTFWIRPTVDDGHIVAKADTTTSTRGFAVYLINSGTAIRLSANQTGSTDSGADLTPDTWSHVVVSVGTSGAAEFYVNNALSASGGTVALPSTITSTAPLRVGSHRSGSTGFYAGRLDDLLIFPGVITAGDRAALYANWEPSA